METRGASHASYPTANISTSEIDCSNTTTPTEAQQRDVLQQAFIELSKLPSVTAITAIEQIEFFLDYLYVLPEQVKGFHAQVAELDRK